MKHTASTPFLTQWRRLARPLALSALMLTAGMTPVHAQSQPEPTARVERVTPVLEARGETASGQTLDLADFRGRVVLVLYWSTDCAVCLDKMPELRANVSGWKDLPFAVVGINLDKRRADWELYEQASATTLSPDHRIPSIWGPGSARLSFQPESNHLPTALVVDKQGQVVHRYEGRIPAQAWDDIADLI